MIQARQGAWLVLCGGVGVALACGLAAHDPTKRSSPVGSENSPRQVAGVEPLEQPTTGQPNLLPRAVPPQEREADVRLAAGGEPLPALARLVQFAEPADSASDEGASPTAVAEQTAAPAPPPNLVIPDAMRSLLDKAAASAAAQPSAVAGESADDEDVPEPAEELGAPRRAAPAAPLEELPDPGTGSRFADTAVPDEIRDEGDDRLSIFVQDRDVREVLAALSEQGGLNILAGKGATGKVSANLRNVSFDEALDAILRSTGLVARREGAFVYVGTPQDLREMDEAQDTLATRIYRPNYVSAEELKRLIAPLLTETIGKVETTSPPLTRIQADSSDAEGYNFAGGDAVIVQDYLSVLAEIDRVVAELDRRPLQVGIEATIVSVDLDDTHRLGVDLKLLRDQEGVLASGSPLTEMAEVTFEEGGLKFAFLDANLGAFLTALETVGDTNVIATPRLMVLNKHRAEILIGEQLGYVSTTITETSSSQNVEFLEIGAQLRIRPFISDDGMIRLEVHPELSDGSVRVESGLTLPEKTVTEVTTNIMVPDTHTVVIGGLIREDLQTDITQLPWLGSLPMVGPLFRTKEDKLKRREILVLITPRIIDNREAACEGDQATREAHRRQAVYADNLAVCSRPHLARQHFRMAQAAWAAGDAEAALRYVQRAIHFSPADRAAIDLRSEIWAATHGWAPGDEPLPVEEIPYDDVPPTDAPHGDSEPGTPSGYVPPDFWLEGESAAPLPSAVSTRPPERPTRARSARARAR
jgi:type IV pilus assembly protein PilQ